MPSTMNHQSEAAQSDTTMILLAVLFRGRATERQDRRIPVVRHVVERSEELRLGLCQLVECVVTELVGKNTIGVLRPYVDDIILYLVSKIGDPCPAVAVQAFSIITKVVVNTHLEQVSTP